MDTTQIEQAVRDGVDLSRGNFAGRTLSGDFRGGKFHKCDFTKADLSNTNLRNADLSEAVLMGAELYGVNLECANLTGANLIGAYLNDASIDSTLFTGCIGLFDAGFDPRGYRFVGVKHPDDGWMVKAGCRWFTIEEAQEHWQLRENDDALARVAQIVEASSK